MNRVDEIKYLQQRIRKIEASEKLNNPIIETTIPAWMFVEIVECFLSNCLPKYTQEVE